jgi:hypothetical protein
VGPRVRAADAVRAWSEAAFALLKSIVLLAAGALVLTAAIAVVTRDRRKTQIAVDLDPGAERVLLDLGSDLELRSMLVDELNRRVVAVTQFARLSADVDTSSADPIPLSSSGSICRRRT